MSLRIAYCIPGLYIPGGMERVLTQKANYLAEKGYEVHIIVTDGKGQEPYFPLHPSIQLHQLGISFEELYGCSFFAKFLRYRKKMRLLPKKLNECLCAISPDITVSLLRRDINVINKMTDGSIKMGELHINRLNYRTFSVKWLPDFLCKWIENYWMSLLIKELKKLAQFVVLTKEDAEMWPEITNVKTIPNPVSFFPKQVATDKQKQVIAVGRYFEEKGFDRLISAWSFVNKSHPDWQLKIFGDGFLRKQLKNQIDTLNLSDSCILEYPVKDIESKYQESSLFVMTSHFEGFGLAIIEAMSCGLPVVSFACNFGPIALVDHNLNGYLVQNGDIKQLADKICLLIDNEDMRLEMGRQARLKAENYRIEHIGKQWENLFAEVIKENRE